MAAVIISSDFVIPPLQKKTKTKTKTKLETRLPGEISITSGMQMTPHLMSESEEQKSCLKKVKEESEKIGLKLNIQKTKIMASSPITSWQIDGKKNGNIYYMIIYIKYTALYICY